MARDRRTLVQKAKELQGLLTEIEAAGYFSVEGVITGAMIDELYSSYWNSVEAEKRPPKDLTAARIWLAVRRLQQEGFPEVDLRGRMGDVEAKFELPDWLKSHDKKHRKKQSILIQQLSADNEEGLNFDLALAFEEIEFIIKKLKERGFGGTGLPVADIYKQGRERAVSNAKTYEPLTSDWTVDPVLDLMHYAISSRHASMNVKWSSTAPQIIYTAWFVQLKQPGEEVEELFLYRGKFIIRAEKTDADTVLLRTCHLQYAFATKNLPVRHDGLMFETGDKHVVLGFSQDNMGNHSPQSMQLDGRNRSTMHGGVYHTMVGWKATTDQFEDVRPDGLLGTGIFMEIDMEMTDAAQGTNSLTDLLDQLTDPHQNYCIRIARADRSRPSPLSIKTTIDNTEKHESAESEVLNQEERAAIVKLRDYNGWTLEDIATLIPGIRRN